jgi:predicted porin
MKKSLFAIAAVTAFAGAAQAQSSVTVYGIMDVGFQGVTSRGPYSATNTTPTNTNITRFSGEGSQTTSRLGFRGNEDLGGGTSAFFTAEFALAPTDATLSGNANNGLFNRQSFVGIAQKGIGRAAIGTQYTPIHMAVGRTDPGQQNNMIGSVIYTTSAAQGNGQTATSYTVRYNNSLTLMTDRMAGFQLNAIYGNNNGSSNQSPTSLYPVGGAVAPAAATGSGKSDNTAFGIGVNYVWKKLNFDAAYQQSKNTLVNGGANVTPSTGGTQTVGLTPANQLGTNVNQTQMYFGAVYDFGILKAYAGYVNSKMESAFSDQNYIQRSGQQLGVRGNWTPKIESWASVGNGSLSAAQGNALGATTGVVLGRASQNFTAYQLGTSYILSKRTNLYAIFGSTQVSSSSVNVSEGGSSYGIGARHTF